MGNTILAKGVNHILAKRDNSAWPKGAKLSGFSNKQKTTETNVTTATETEVTETQKTTAEAETKETAQTEEEKYPKTNPFLWVLNGIGLAAVLAAGFYIRYKIVKNRR